MQKFVSSPSISVHSVEKKKNVAKSQNLKTLFAIPSYLDRGKRLPSIQI